MSKIKNHFAKIENKVVYVLFLLAFGFAVNDDGFLPALNSFIFLFYTFGGAALFVDVALIFKGYKYRLTALKVFGYLIIAICPAVKLYIGISKPLILLGPIYFGIIFLLLFLFSSSDLFQSIRDFETGLEGRVRNVFKKKT